jgi:hypothetical protein
MTVALPSNAQRNLVAEALAIENLRVTPPLPKAGDVVTFDYELYNRGSGSIRGGGVELAVCEQIDGAFCFVVSQDPATFPGIAPGQRLPFHQTLKLWKVPRRPLQATFTVALQTPPGAVAQGAVMWKPIDAVLGDPPPPVRGQAQMPDMVWVGRLMPHGEWTPGGRASVAAKVKSIGAMGANTKIRFSLCRKTQPEGCILLKEITYSIPLIDTEIESGWFSLPLGVELGARVVRGELDPEGKISERDENNNRIDEDVLVGAPLLNKYVLHKNQAIPNYNTKRLHGKVSRDACLRACSLETSFICKSADYKRAAQECTLNGHSRLEFPLKSYASTDHYARPCQAAYAEGNCAD